MNETQQLAHIIAGEAMGCPFEAMLLVAWMFATGINTRMYGWSDTPSQDAWMAAYFWWIFPNPVPEAEYLFSREDTYRPAVRQLIGHDPPLAVWECEGGLALYAYA